MAKPVRTKNKDNARRGLLGGQAEPAVSAG